LVDPSNPTQEKVQRRGVRYKSIYESRLLEDTATKARVLKWMAMGEEARVYHGELPQKLIIFDSRVVLMPIVRSGEALRTVVLRHPDLAQTLSFAFQYLWEKADPIARQQPEKTETKAGVRLHRAASHRNDKPAPGLLAT
jgi:hypothetical protein